MGLLDGLFSGFDPNDPRRFGLMMAAANGLQGRGSNAQVIGQMLQGGLLGYHTALAAQDRRAEEAQQREARDLEIKRSRGLLDREQQIGRLADSAYGPNPNLVQNDDMGYPIPQAPGGGGDAEFLRGYQRVAPLQAIALRAQLAQANARDFKTVPKGDRLVDMSGGQPRVTLDAMPELPPGMRMGSNGQPEWMPGYIEGQSQIRAAGRQQTNVNLPPAQKAFEVELAKLDAKQLDDMRDSAMKAQDGLSRIGQMKQLAQQGVYSGWGASGRANAANFFDTLGVPFDRTKLANSQEYVKHAKELTLSMLKAGVGSTNISNADLAFVNETVPQLETNPKARLDLLNYMEGRLGQSVERFGAADAYARQHGGLSGFNYGPRQQKGQPVDLKRNMTATYQARQAIQGGKSRDAVIQRMIEQGYDPSGL